MYTVLPIIRYAPPQWNLRACFLGLPFCKPASTRDDMRMTPSRCERASRAIDGFERMGNRERAGNSSRSYPLIDKIVLTTHQVLQLCLQHCPWYPVRPDRICVGMVVTTFISRSQSGSSTAEDPNLLFCAAVCTDASPLRWVHGVRNRDP